MMGAFYRIGPAIPIPVGPNTQGSRVPVTMPAGATAFIFINPNRFICSLRGTTAEQDAAGQFNQTSLETGWVILPGVMGPFGTLRPVAVSGRSHDNPALGDDGLAGPGVLYLQYGNGGM